MFLNRPNSSEPANIVEPLRISKRGNAASPVGGAQSGRQSSGSAYPMPSLPYPDQRATSPPTQSNGSPAPYPYPDVRRNTPVQNIQGRRTGSASSSDHPSVLRPSSAQTASSLGERRGNVPKPLPDSPGPEPLEKDDLFSIPIQKGGMRSPPPQGQHQQPPWPNPGGIDSAQEAFNRLTIRDPSGINRMSSTASTATTKATRGSPPPPETPVVGPNGAGGPRPLTDIEQRFHSSGIPGTETMSNYNAFHGSAAQQRMGQYGGQQPSQQQQQTLQPPRRPWTPTEAPGSSPHPAPVVYHGADPTIPAEMPQSQPQPQYALPSQQLVYQQAQQSQYGQPYQQQPQSNQYVQQPHPHPQPQPQQSQPLGPYKMPQNLMDNDANRPQAHEEPPPAYSAGPGIAAVGYPQDKHRQSMSSPAQIQVPASAVPTLMNQTNGQVLNNGMPPNQNDHPAYHNDYNRQSQFQQPVQQNVQPAADVMQPQQPQIQRQPSISQGGPSAPPPLPEGWISHLDPNSGQYYYIHLPTQSTQWEFPKGPTPLNLSEVPMSPAGGNFQYPLSPGPYFSHKPLASPGIPGTPGFDGMMSMGATLSNPAAFSGPPPVSGVELFKVVATNGVYFGPYLRYGNMDMERGLWLGSILLVTDAAQPPTIHLHQSQDLSPNPRQLKGLNIATHQRWTFYKYEVEIKMDDAPAKWTYAITSHLGCTRYEFLVAGRNETNWRFIAVSGNDFSMNASANERARLGGVSFMWKDIMQKHSECGGFHAQLGLGGQINADRIWKDVPALKQWLATSGKENRKNAIWTAAHEEDVTHAYFHYYTSHFDQPYLREAFAQIPHVLIIDDHDM